MIANRSRTGSARTAAHHSPPPPSIPSVTCGPTRASAACSWWALRRTSTARLINTRRSQAAGSSYVSTRSQDRYARASVSWARSQAVARLPVSARPSATSRGYSRRNMLVNPSTSTTTYYTSGSDDPLSPSLGFLVLVAEATSSVDACANRAPTSHRLTRSDSSSLVPSLVLGDTGQHGLTRHELSSKLTGTAQHRTAHSGRSRQTTQIYEGTNQIQRIVIAKRLFS